MADDGASYLRCKHCKGFYETSFARCKWCEYDDPVRDRDNAPKVYPDRQICRAIQLAEFEQLPADVQDDPMAPPKDDPALLCACLHCGPDGHYFEAIEMRWMPNEEMWACPCTTCGGRGFNFDIHSAENKWQCAECGHFYVPANRDYRSDNAKCPRCGSTMANGWFDDGDDDEDFDDDDDGIEEDDQDEAMHGFSPIPPVGPGEALADDELPWDDDEEADDESDGEIDLNGDRCLPDDIDFPDTPRTDIDIKDDDIPF